MKTKKKFTMLLLVFAVLLAAGGCWSLTPMNTSNLMRIKTGMSKADIENLFGLPHYRQVDSEGEVWKYKYMAAGGDDFLLIRFFDDKVKSFDSYFKRQYEGPQISTKVTTGT